MTKVTIIGGGLAGAEAAWQARGLGAPVTLFEMKPVRFSPAHKIDGLAELVCSNSLKSESLENAGGILKEEMRVLGSLIIKAAGETRVPAGTALAVDRDEFSKYITAELRSAGVEVVRQEIKEVPVDRPLVIATGPLTSASFAAALEEVIGPGVLCFYDAIAPIVHADSIDMAVAFFGSRYGKGGAQDYLNCPLDRSQYDRLVRELLGAEKAPVREFEKIPFFEGCMPVEAMAERGPETLAFGPLKPVGFTDPATGGRPHALVQLRRENKDGTIYNMVGFQTRLTYPEQKRVFRLIPGLEGARFARLGSIHRNSFIDSPRLLERTSALRTDGGLFIAGQMTGVEGYVESAASGLVSGINAAMWAMGREPSAPPPTTMTGALLDYVSSAEARPFQPMKANFGVLSGYKGKKRRGEAGERAMEDIKGWANKILERSL